MFLFQYVFSCNLNPNRLTRLSFDVSCTWRNFQHFKEMSPFHRWLYLYVSVVEINKECFKWSFTHTFSFQYFVCWCILHEEEYFSNHFSNHSTEFGNQYHTVHAIITRNVFKKDSASGVTNEGLGFSPTSSTRTGSFSDLSVFILYWKTWLKLKNVIGMLLES